MGKHLRTMMVLGRVSNLPTLWTNVLAGWFLAGGSWCGELGWMMAGLSLLYVGGMTLNDAFDVEWDKKNAPERPVPAGAISVAAVWTLGWVQMLAGVLLVVLFTTATWYFLFALVYAIVLYDWTHKRWKGAVFAMAACRFLVYIVAASAAIEAGQRIPLEVFLYAAGLFIYVLAITIAARGESTGGKVGWLGKRLLLMPFVIGLVVISMGSDHVMWMAEVAAVLVFIRGMIFATRQLRSTQPDRIGKYVSALLAGIILVDLIALAQFGIIFWLICGALLLVTLLAQRWIPAT